MILTLLDRWRAPAADAGRVGWMREYRYAHRGLHGAGVPENSPSAFALAIEAGTGIECDIQRSSDGRAMVFHDWELDRLTGESGPVAQRPASALAQIQLTGSADRMLTLEALLDQVAGRVPLLIEVKSRRDYRIVPSCLAVRRALEGYRGQHAVMSFDPRVSRWFAVHSPHTIRGLVVTEEHGKSLAGSIRRHAALWHARPDFLAYDIRDLPSRFAASQRARGLPVLSWTVRDEELLARAAEHADAPIAEGTGLV
ncbi:MAG: glycerophosphodiester phosphodiesterase [Sphingomonadales bacterium]|nr:glycerophosphodiester phosphodiesterase [Sphingomonadales bacterium]MBD3773756.1 glycerophosphodiester phosphodiesterase [Paracoccaceae bacterium]